MPRGKIHDIITFVTLPFVVIGTYVLTNSYLNTLIVSISYLFSAIMFNGDLDTNSKPYNRWWLFKMVWIPYQLMFSHRSIFTHGIIIGTVIRVLYISTIPFLILYYSYGINIITDFLNYNYLLLIFVGLELGSLSHSIPDWIT